MGGKVNIGEFIFVMRLALKLNKSFKVSNVLNVIRGNALKCFGYSNSARINKRKQSLIFDASFKMLHTTFSLDVPKTDHMSLSIHLASEHLLNKMLIEGELVVP